MRLELRHCVCPLFLLLLTTTTTRAVVIYSGVRNITAPNTGEGLYLNVIDGTSYTGPNVFPTVPGPGADWDINPFGSVAWEFFVPNNGGQSQPIPVPVNQKGYVATSATGAARNLPAGTLIGASSTFNTQGPDGALVATGAPALLGFRFRNETLTPFTAHYGWARLILTNGQPGTVVDWAWEATPDTAIAAGEIPEPSSLLLILVPCFDGASRYQRRRAR
jgi:hypothetical protein